MCRCMCSTKFVVVGILLSAIPIALLVYLELEKPSSHVYHYHSSGWLRECAKWDPLHHRFLVSFMSGGMGQISVPRDSSEAESGVLEEVQVVNDADLAGNASLGLLVDPPRNRVLLVNADAFGKRYSALSAYDLSTWKRLFLTQLSGPNDEKSFAEDVAVDEEGNAYVTDAHSNKLWKVGVDGKLLSTIRSPDFSPKEWYKNLVGLNGIVYHPDGYLLVVHTFSGGLFKVDTKAGNEKQVKSVEVWGGPLTYGDGIELVSPTKLVVAGNPSGRLVESSDGWETASISATFYGPKHRLASAATVKDGKVYLNHLVGIGYPKRKHALVEAVFTS